MRAIPHLPWYVEGTLFVAGIAPAVIMACLFLNGSPGKQIARGICTPVGRLGRASFAFFKTFLKELKGPRPVGLELGPITVTNDDRVRHTHIVGSTGSGKTEVAKYFLYEDILEGRGCFIIDPKGDRELYEEIRGFCARVGRLDDLRLLSATYLDESCVWNPCGLGNASELQSKFYNSNVYSEPFYAKACESGLIRSFKELLEERPQGFGLNELTATLKKFAQLEKSKSLEGLFYDFENLAQSEWASVLGCDARFAQGREISFLDMIRDNRIVFVDLPTEGKSVQSSRIGRLLTQELILISGLRKSCPGLVHKQSKVFSVYIDEFDAFATESFITFLNKARSSGFMIHIIHQTLSDLKKISPEFLSQVLGLCNIHLIGIQHDPDDAELWSRYIGTQKTIKMTYQTQPGLFGGDVRTGLGSERESQEFIVPPDVIKELSTGQFLVSVKTQRARQVIRFQMVPRFGKRARDQTAEIMKGRTRGLAAAKVRVSKWSAITKEST